MGKRNPNNARQVRGSNPEFLNPETLLQEYTPLMKSIFRMFVKYYPFFVTKEAKEDLWANIQLEFLSLRREYDYTRGVDFPGYITLTLQNRVYNRHIAQLKREHENEVVRSDVWDTNQFSTDGGEFENESEHRYTQDIDESAELAYENMLARNSVPWELFSDLQCEIVERVLRKKSLEDISAELGMKFSDVNLLFEEIIRKILTQEGHS